MAKAKKVYICYAPDGSTLWFQTGSTEAAERAGISRAGLVLHLRKGSADKLGRTYDIAFTDERKEKEA